MTSQRCSTNGGVRLVTALSLLICLAVLSTQAMAATYYVSPTGSSGNPGTQASPWSLAKANTDLYAGDTAIIMDGSYSTQIQPSRSGTAGNPITYRAENSRMALLTSGNPRILIDNRSYITLDGIKSLHTSSRWLHGNNSSHITVNDCYFLGNASGSFETGRFRDSGGYITVTNSTLDGQADGIHIRESSGHYIANNQILEDVHSPLVLMGVTDSVVENNYFNNPVHRNIEILSTRLYMPPNEHRTNYIVVQDNYFFADDDDNKASSIKMNSSYSILRRNVFDQCPDWGLRFPQAYGSTVGDRPEGWFCVDNRAYNNTFYGMGESIQAAKSDSVIFDGGAYGGTICINNIIYAGTGIKQINLYADIEPADISFYYNSIMRSSPGQTVFYVIGNKTVAQVESAWPANYANNYEFNPMFTNAAADDFTLQAGSPCIDAGGNLTTAIGSGTGTVIPVVDSLYFTDGYGLIDPDIIRIGGSSAQIVSIDRGSHLITVDRTITWSPGDPVNLDYNGSAPDLGAFESGSSSRIAGRHIFYNNSSWDGNDAGASVSDDAAIATNKTALLPDETASFPNYTSYSKGINGIMVDIDFLPGTPAASDFSFRVGNSSQPGLWSPLAVTPVVSLRSGAGTDGSDRVTIILPDGTAAGQWLEVTVKSSVNTGLLTDDVFYYGNAIGETGDSITDAEVTPTDEIYVRNNPATLAVSSASISHAADFNRDKKVGPTDQIICRNNGTNSSTALQLMTATVNAQPTVDAGPGSSIDLAESAILDGTASDDGNPSSLTTTWSKVSGPGVVTFGNASAIDTTATFTAAGVYTLELEAFDGEKTATDTVEITVIATIIFFGDDFEDDDLVGWSVLAGSFDTFQFVGQTNYEVHATATNSRMRANLTNTSLSDTAYLSFKVRHTGGAPGGIGGDTGNKTGHIWFVDDSGAGFGLYIILSQDGTGMLDLYTTTDDGATMSYVGSYTAPAAIVGNGLKQVELVYNRVTDQVECVYDTVSIGTIAVSSAYRNFTRVVVSLAELYGSFGDPVTHVWGQLDIDDIRLANSSVNN